MKRFAMIALLIFSFTCNAQTSWKPTTSAVSFKIRNAGLTVTGRFSNFRGDMKFSPDKLAGSHLQGSVEVSTINTGISKRDKDLQHEKYFNSTKYKVIELSSTKLYQKGSQYAGMFKVTMKGITKEMEIPFTFVQKGNNATFSATFTINRRDFGIGGKTLTMADDADVTVVVTAKQ